MQALFQCSEVDLTTVRQGTANDFKVIPSDIREIVKLGLTEHGLKERRLAASTRSQNNRQLASRN